jgi:cystathionine beta-synthase
VVGVGSSGTVTGLGKYFHEVLPDLEMIVADPVGSILADTINTGLADTINTGKTPKASSWLVEGIGEDFMPPICDISLVKKGYSVSDRDAFHNQRELLRREGIIAGSSTGTLLTAALRYCNEQTEPKRVLTFACDTGNKYLNKSFNDSWLADQGLLERDSHGDLRDLIARPLESGDMVTVTSEDNLITTYKRMRMFDVSQLPVVDHGHIVGLIDESDILLGIYEDKDSFQMKVAEVMVTDLEKVPPSARIDAIVNLFKQGKVAIIADDDNFYGLITQIDLINHLRKSMF